MRIDILTCVPNLLDSFFAHSILKRAQQGGFVEVMVHDIRDYSVNKHRTIDDYAFGGGAGMVLQIEPIARCIRGLQEERSYDEIIYLTPDGELMQQPMVNQLSLKGNIIMLCGHYKGVDQRVRDMFITKEVSIGDYVLSGGELAAAVLSDAIIRLLPGVLNDETSALTDSFQDNLLAPPVYTRPADFEGHKVPEILMSGHEAKIEEWRYEQSVQRTRERRPDLL
ncbi:MULTISPECIES: tRNA (guanosine(37)-N1)-methyltransferase TrmD [Dyadobacter]|uniref:tRNA (guanine-N(1)-)-methyltransferase n=1 Tax=Dyadobacter chenhuakuii TaxID=2909339 RepID=A0ABY4XLS0_9BACT|nr:MULTISPECIES: tRNA (guanosine(37)-N1)-methyltransferase TrmD [Dyadobacter]MCF2493877.1 tRNA (guanosine(37)-N1)-methyltransferase TrmD [Dyadobacter chenhuakuii]MCF2518125.1 tRNA (guanosine(37)-N1)-methyltransferase TrmD [Dyadobacter sp. CY351]USJ31008.1 tRNA (guanosine(37)-N1)-methyltransferase TrmD [Dyadobacter chenhuakuii]